MKPSSKRTLAALVVLAWGGGQPAAALAVVADALISGLHEHAHRVALLSDAGHLDLVLSHGEGAAHRHAGAAHDHDCPVALSESDHVVHVAADAAASATPRRLCDAPPSLVVAALPVAPAPAWVLRPASEPRACVEARLRTVVLRL